MRMDKLTTKFQLAPVEDKGALGELMRAAGATEAALGQAVDQVRGGERVADPGSRP